MTTRERARWKDKKNFKRNTMKKNKLGSTKNKQKSLRSKFFDYLRQIRKIIRKIIDIYTEKEI